VEISKTLYVTTREEWRRWLEEHHATEPEIWLVYYTKASGKPRIPYNDAVEEALCFGWIDSIQKGIDDERRAQRFSPRKPKSNWSDLNKARVRKLISAGKMAQAGLAALGNVLEGEFRIADDILAAIQADGDAWKHFQQFDEEYKQIRIGYIEGARSRPDEFKKRLANFVKMTAANKQFGTIP
jgi:uncharacterized protein YdeI (YjbR/CyaY-like superfamily)